MAGNSFGQAFKITTFGESHGLALGAIVDGCPPGLEISSEALQVDLDRRKPGQSKHTTQRKEPDQVEILGGIFEGKTTGTSIGLLIKNTDQKSKDYSNIKDLFRPGHADYTYTQKHGFRDYRGGGRSSARETAMRVAVGGIAKAFLKSRFDIEIKACCNQIGSIKAETYDWSQVSQNDFFFPDATKVSALDELLTQIRRDLTSIGAKVKVVATNVPVGLGEPVFDRLDADIAKALMSINAVRAVAIGDGFDVVEQTGDVHRDEMTPEGFLSNHAGGILGGISTGQDIEAELALKPTSSIQIPGKTITIDGEQTEVVTKGRHDPCVGIRAVPIAEAMVAIVLMDHLLRHKGQNFEVTPPAPTF